MTTLIVSPSAVLRGALKEVLGRVPGGSNWLETGSLLQVERLLTEKRPQVVLWDEALGETDEMIQRANFTGSFHLVLLVSSVNGGLGAEKGPRVTKMEKADFATVSVPAYAELHAPQLGVLFEELSRRTQKEQNLGRSGAGPVSLVVIGASTGGPAAIKKVLEVLPADFPCPIALVQHIDTGYESGFAEWLDQNTRLRVRLAQSNDTIQPGEVIVAPTERHLVCLGVRFDLDDGPKIYSQRPSVDRLFATAAPLYGEGLVGVLLTGIGWDGAHGCLDILLHGGFTFVQDEATSTVWGMPKAAVELGAASRVLGLSEIGPQLLELVQKRAKE